jgi:predicted membrane channel-forming protein YqfA (hemolysin III family)
MLPNEQSKNAKFIDGLRKQTRTRKRYAIVYGSISALFLCASIWFHHSVNELQVRGRDMFARVDGCSPTVIRTEIWLAHDFAVIRARMYSRTMFFALMWGIGLGMMFNRLFSRKDDILLTLWDRTRLLEEQLAQRSLAKLDEHSNQDS